MKRLINRSNYLFIVVLFFSLCGIVVSFVLLVDKIELLRDPSIKFGCNLNSVINCSSVMNSPEANVLGFPNPILGLIFYTGVAMGSLILLTGGMIKNRLMHIGFFLSVIAVIFSYWLLSSSVFRIHSLCLYCVVSCFSATNIMLTMGAYLYKDKVPSKLRKWYLPLITLFYVVIAAIVILQLNLFTQS